MAPLFVVQGCSIVTTSTTKGGVLDGPWSRKSVSRPGQVHFRRPGAAQHGGSLFRALPPAARLAEAFGVW